MTGVVIMFDDTEFTAHLSVPDVEDLESLIGKEAIFELIKGRPIKGRVVGVEADMVVVKFDELPMGLGQGSQVAILD